jgi:hypothetical protein
VEDYNTVVDKDGVRRKYHRQPPGGNNGRQLRTQCRICSQPFWPVRRKARYCSAACRMIAMRRRKRKAKGLPAFKGEHDLMSRLWKRKKRG